MKRVVLTVGVAALVLGLAACPTDVDLGHIDETPSLSVVWGDYFPMGNIVASISYGWRHRPADIGNAGRWGLLTRHFDILTAEDEMKPDFINTQAGFGSANRLVNTSLDAGMRVHGHALAWHGQTPAWMFAGGNRDQAIANLQTHIERTMRHFGTRVESWDVLNEIFASGVGTASGPLPVTADNWRLHLRGRPGGAGTSGWYNSIGSDPNGYCFIWIAFTTARREADEIDRAAGRPLGTMILYYNDYNEEQPNKRAAIYYMVRELNERFAAIPGNANRLLIDAIGMQAHYHRGHVEPGDANWPWRLNVNNVRDSINRFASLPGVFVSITELDVTVGDTHARALTREQEREQAIVYAQLFQIFRDFAAENPGRLRRVSIWGLCDPSSWRARGSPTLFDGRLRPKEAFWAVADPEAFLANPGAFARGTSIEAMRAAAVNIPPNAWGPR